MTEKQLTQEQRDTISFYILLSAGYREREAEAWEKLAQERKEDGSPKFPKAAGNAKFFRDLGKQLEEIRAVLEAV